MCVIKVSIVDDPILVVIFINVDGSRARSPIGIRANRSQLIESDTSAHNVSKPSRYRYFKNINRR